MFGSDRVPGSQREHTGRFDRNLMQHGANTCSLMFTGLAVSKHRLPLLSVTNIPQSDHSALQPLNVSPDITDQLTVLKAVSSAFLCPVSSSENRHEPSRNRPHVVGNHTAKPACPPRVYIRVRSTERVIYTVANRGRKEL
ncbi:hypothetical protein CRENBAI_003908 [Crenichthys baileyi]|uniref:Uncharacterized protein n=1 Tax=Crenichthys baileyi TaxID=28760 RepID=A0AAV9QZB4_9TELE